MLLLAIVSFVVVLTVLSIVSIIRFTGQALTLGTSTYAASNTPPVTILKPLCGADDALEQNLETFFRQTYPRFEIVFGVEGDKDPAIAVVRRLQDRFPNVIARLVIHSGGRALNPKVGNLMAMLEVGAHSLGSRRRSLDGAERSGAEEENVTEARTQAASNDMVVISDSNVSVDPTWLAQMVAEFQAERGMGLLMNLFVGTGEENLGATLENLHLAGPVAGSLAFTQEFSTHAACVGKSLLFRRSAFDALGGFPSIGAFLAEDYVMGRMYAEAGFGVRIAAVTVNNVVARTTPRKFVARQVRWSLLRSRLNPLVYALEPLANPMLLVVLAPFAGLYAGALALTGLGLTLARDAIQWIRLRGRAGLVSALPLGPAKDLVMLGVWAAAPFLGRVAWRGKSYRVSAGTRLYADRPLGLE